MPQLEDGILGKLVKAKEEWEFLPVSAFLNLCSTLLKEKNKISCCPFIFKVRPIDYWFFLSQRQLLPSCLSCCVSWELSLVTIRNVGWAPFAARVYCQHSEKFSIWLSLGVALDLRRVIFFHSLWKHILGQWGCKWKMLPAILVYKGCAAIKPLQPPPTVHPEGTQDGKEQDTGPR